MDTTTQMSAFAHCTQVATKLQKHSYNTALRTKKGLQL